MVKIKKRSYLSKKDSSVVLKQAFYIDRLFFETFVPQITVGEAQTSLQGSISQASHRSPLRGPPFPPSWRYALPPVHLETRLVGRTWFGPVALSPWVTVEPSPKKM